MILKHTVERSLACAATCSVVYGAGVEERMVIGKSNFQYRFYLPRINIATAENKPKTAKSLPTNGKAFKLLKSVRRVRAGTENGGCRK